MALVFAPLCSFDARGQIARAIVFSIWKGKNYARRYIIPQNPQTVAQTYVRWIFAAAVNGWHYLLDAAGQGLWDDSASLPSGMSGFNWYVGSYCNAMHAGTTPPTTPP